MWKSAVSGSKNTHIYANLSYRRIRRYLTLPLKAAEEQMKKTADNCAILKSDSQYTIFIFKDQVIRFATSSKLERYTEVKEWDKGYLVVMAKYTNLNEMEEYIDLVPILQNLNYDVDEFIAPIKEVRIDYAV